VVLLGLWLRGLAVQARLVALISLRNPDRLRVVGFPVGVSSSVTLVQQIIERERAIQSRIRTALSLSVAASPAPGHAAALEE